MTSSAPSRTVLHRYLPIRFLFEPFGSMWRHRRLVWRLAKRHVQMRYKSTVLGFLWAAITPLLMLSVYTFVFAVVFEARWGTVDDSNGNFALLLFTGLSIFNFFAECLGAAPKLMVSNVNYIKKVIFPLEIMPWVSVIGALVNSLFSFTILFSFYILAKGIPPVTALLFPLVLVPLILLALGCSWFLSSLGVFLRDLQQVVGLLTTILMFLSAIFYPIERVPESFRVFIYANPVAVIIHQARQVIFFAHWPDWEIMIPYVAIAWIFAAFGYAWFVKTKKGFADVV